MKIISKLEKNIASLAFGGAAISGEGKGYGFGELTESKAQDLLLKSFDRGINLYDFAPIYGHHLAEKRAGKAFRKVREKVYLVSKSGVDWHDSGRVNMTNDPKVALKMLDQSLKNFDSDYIDFYLIHWPDKRIDIRRPLEVLYNQKEKGKITHLGLCNTTKEDLTKAKEVCPVEVIQMEANLFNQNPFHELDSQLDEAVLKLGWGTYDKGILSGSVTLDRIFDSTDCRSWAPWWKKSDWKNKVKFVDALCFNYKISPEKLASLALSCSQGIVDVSLCGMRNESHLSKNINYLKSVHPELEEVMNEFTTY